uniref:Uncharacterized protein n=1 Tax=Rhizophora mucronata TaxID=61149 RepID=A0A2P2MN70_RHIMU
MNSIIEWDEEDILTSFYESVITAFCLKIGTLPNQNSTRKPFLKYTSQIKNKSSMYAGTLIENTKKNSLVTKMKTVLSLSFTTPTAFKKRAKIDWRNSKNKINRKR